MVAEYPGAKPCRLSGITAALFLVVGTVVWQQTGRQPARLAGQRAHTAPTAPSVTAPAAVHGYVHKQGTADLRSWAIPQKTFRAERQRQWMKEREAALEKGRLPPPLPLMAMGVCQVFVNHAYKLIYIRHPKTGSSSLLCHFNGCNGTDLDAAHPTQDPLSFQILNALARNMTGRELNKLWKDYFVVSFVRNPFQRAVSMYRMFMREVELGGTEDRTYTWNQFCADPAGFGAKCEADEKCKTRGGQSYTFTHMQPQMDCMVTEGGGWAVDFIGRVEHMDEDLQAVLDELERRREADVPPVRPLENGLRHYNERGCNHSKEELERLAALGKPMAKEQYCEPEQYYEGQHAACLRAIPHHYASDVHMLGFD